MMLIILILSSAHAQTPQVITFDDAIRIALERNSQLRQAQVSAALDDLAVNDARMQFLPNLGAGVSGSQNFGRYFDSSEGRIVQETTQSLGAGVSSGLTLFNGFRDVAALRRAKLDRDAGTLDLRRTEESVVFAVAQNFLVLTQRQELLRVRREDLAAQSQLERQLQLYVEAGARPVADLYQQQANLAAAKVAMVEAEGAAESAQITLMRTLQLDPAGAYDFQPPDMQPPATAPLSLQEVLARAWANRKDLQAEEARLKAAEQSVRIAYAGYWPSLGLSAGYSSGYTDASPLSFKDQLDLRRGGSVSLSLSIPLFNRNATRNAAQRARLQALNARIAFEDIRQEIGVQIRQAYLDHRSAQERFAAAQTQRHAAERAVQTAEERFKAGASSLIELSQARAGFVQAESALANARTQLSFQRTVIDYHAGDLDPDAYR